MEACAGLAVRGPFQVQWEGLQSGTYMYRPARVSLLDLPRYPLLRAGLIFHTNVLQRHLVRYLLDCYFSVQRWIASTNCTVSDTFS